MMLKKAQILNFTKLYRFGQPFKTDAVVRLVDDGGFEPIEAPLITIEGMAVALCKGGIAMTISLSPEDRVYGLGETVGALNKRGKKYRLYTTDDPVHTPDKENLYGSHPFVLVGSALTNPFGFFIDYPSEICLDVGFTNHNVMEVVIPSMNFDIYFIRAEGRTLTFMEIVKEFLLLTGAPYCPPKWAFGYQQSRWSYPDAKSIAETATRFREEGIPCDAIYMDIDYMDNFKVFTVDEEKFPDFATFTGKLKSDGFRVIPIIDPGVKIEDGYGVYEEGRRRGLFCQTRDGSFFKAAVWPGLTHLPDFLMPETRRWWGGLCKKFLDMGVEGFWLDMNEPSIFYTPEAMQEVFNLVDEIKKNPDIPKRRLQDMLNGLSNNRGYFREFYHRTHSGGRISNEEIHNLYGTLMTQGVADGFITNMPGQRYFLLTRSSYVGLHRYAAIWTGDNMSWWEHMIAHIRMLMSLNMAGVFYTGADIGGFGSDVSPELQIRWMQLGVFSPLFRNHSAMGTRRREPWAFDGQALDIMRDTIKLRYALIPYAYSEFMRSVRELSPFIRPLMFDFDCRFDVEDQFMYGGSVMAAPVILPNATGRYVLLPAVSWLYCRASGHSAWTVSVIPPGVHYIDCPLDSTPFFIKENSILTLSEPVNYIGEREIDVLRVAAFVTETASFTYYEDDGLTDGYKKGVYCTIQIDIASAEGQYDISIKAEGAMATKITRIDFEIYDRNAALWRCSRHLYN
ncbi:TIM-barrel domain-containing protein [Candidatus Magnetominusculus dajiuhuensis]|uniref:TIM-barrel domain-containing protein n=1 Tax=Candidatus Magnetominusculus dajiuhuensis TaxID=3137712 RepID=UPI003B42D922